MRRCSSPGARAKTEEHTIQFQEADAEKQAAITQDLLALMESRNRSGDSTLVLPSEYLEIVIERK